MKYSVVSPILNGMPKIRQCIGSVKVQAGDNIEVEHIIQDGGSSDGTIMFLKEYESKVESLNVEGKTSQDYSFSYASELDNGMYDAINKGWDRAKGDILSWLNHDEQYLPGTLADVSRIFAQHPEVDAVFGNMIVVDPEGRPLSARREIPLRAFYVKNDFLYAISCTLFFRKRLREEGLLVFDTSYKSAGDMELVMRLLSNGKKFAHLSEYIALFGVNGHNLTVVLGDNMAKETRRIQQAYGGYSMASLRKAVKCMRWMERLFCGCYRKEDVAFDYALNEEPEYVHRSKRSLGVRFTYDYVEKLMAQNDE